MKKLLLSIAVFSTILTSAQVKTVTISSESIPTCIYKITNRTTIKCKYSKLVDLNPIDTNLVYQILSDPKYDFFIEFLNQKYEFLEDRQWMFFQNQSDLTKFLNDLKSAILEIGPNVTINYSDNVMVMNKGIIISSNDGGFIFVDKNGVDKLIKYLSLIEIGRG